MQKKIHAFIKKHGLIKKGDTIVLGLSGGPDSIFLLHFLANLYHKKEINLIAAHLDHQWQKDSHKDVQFCHDACMELGIPFVYTTMSDLDLPVAKRSTEEHGRIMRRHFLESVAKENKADVIALGHHAQDQQETFFIRLIRGTTLSGLAAIRPKHGMYIRPLLEINKDDIIAYLKKNKIKFLIDPSNVSEKYLRNRIRKHVIPALKKCDERFDKHFARTINHLQDAELTLENLTHQTFTKLATLKNKTYYIDLKEFLLLQSYLQKRFLMMWLIAEKVPFVPTESFLHEIIRFLKQPGSKKHTIHHAWDIAKQKNKVHIQKTI